jgi:hypothetical protein
MAPLELRARVVPVSSCASKAEEMERLPLALAERAGAARVSSEEAATLTAAEARFSRVGACRSTVLPPCRDSPVPALMLSATGLCATRPVVP